MDRREEALVLAEALLTDVELAETSTARRVLKAVRLARLTQDSLAQEWLGFEVNGVPGNDAGKRHMTATKRWTKREENLGHWSSASTLQATRDSSAANVAALSGQVSLSGDSILVTMRERNNTLASWSNLVASMDKILGAIDSKIHRYASDAYAELRYSELQAGLFSAAQASIDAALTSVAGRALDKIDSISERLQHDDAEAISQAMSTSRRLIDAVADHVFDPSDEPYYIGEQRLSVKKSNVLNRLNAHVHRCGAPAGRTARIRRSLADIYERVSAGVHADVDSHEARYLFLSTYILLGEIITLPKADHAVIA